jgi:hypothetical protein
MKIACSSAAFAHQIADGELTQLEWLDVCANELEIDGVVFDAAHFPRTDGEYLAQLKKSAADLGLGVAALAAADALDAGARETRLAQALALGAPLLVVTAPAAAEDAAAWGAFTDALQALARAAKTANVTLALRNVAGTLCASPVDLKRAAKDVDSSWLRFALDAASFGDADAADGVLAKSALAVTTIADLATFATSGDAAADEVIARLARFRGFVCLDAPAGRAAAGAYHAALERFAAKRANALVTSAFVAES